MHITKKDYLVVIGELYAYIFFYVSLIPDEFSLDMIYFFTKKNQLEENYIALLLFYSTWDSVYIFIYF